MEQNIRQKLIFEILFYFFNTVGIHDGHGILPPDDTEKYFRLELCG